MREAATRARKQETTSRTSGTLTDAYDLYDLVLALSLIRPRDPDDVEATRRAVALLEDIVADSYSRCAGPALVTVAVEVDA